MTEKEIAQICKALSDPNRLKIVKLLTGGEQCACKLLEAFEINHSTLSHHMKVLSECNLVTTRKETKWSFYTLNTETLSDFKIYIENLSSTKQSTTKCECK
jgi:ArsR family transcriptional regulator